MPLDYLRKIPPELHLDDAAVGYIRPKEHVDSDEDAVIAQVREATVAATRKQPKAAGKQDASFHEPSWGHTTGLLRGTLAIDRIEALPEPFRVGLFAQKRSLPVIARPNYVHDKHAGAAFARLSVKVAYPEPVPNMYAPSGLAHELDLLFAEGSPEVNGVGHTFFFRDARELAMILAMAPPSLKTLQTLLVPRNWGLAARVLKRLKAVTGYVNSPAAQALGWAGRPYYCAGPFVLGEGAMKFCLLPRQTHTAEVADNRKSDPTQRQRAAMQAWLAAGKDAVFDLCVQLATAECIPAPGAGDPSKSVMTAEYCDLQWDETKSPYVAVGTLTLPANAQSDLSQAHPWSPLQFNAWNTLPSMRPLGQTFRARKHVHKAHCEARLQHIYDTTPGALVGNAPFTSAEPK